MATWRKVIVSGSSAVLNQISASGNIVPTSDNGADLGSSTLEWKDLYIDGTAHLDTANIAAGTITGITDLAVADSGTGQSNLNDLITMGTHTTGNYVATITGGTGIDSDGATSGESIAHSLTLDLNELGAETSIAQADFVAMVDATDDGSQKITFSDFEDQIFGNVSGDIAISAGGAAVVTGATTNAALTAGTGLSTSNGTFNGASAVTFALDLSELSDVQIASGDKLAVLDSDGANEQLESIDDVATLFAGDGLQAASAVMAVDVSDFAGTGLEDDSSENLRLASQGTGISGGAGSTLSITPGQTAITSVYNTALKVGSAASQEYVDFSTTDEVNTKIDDTERLSVTATGIDVTGNATISGNLTVNGTQTTISSSIVDIGDNIIQVNGTPVTYGGLHVKDATGNQTGSMVWDTVNNYWKGGISGSEYRVPELASATELSGNDNRVLISDGTRIDASAAITDDGTTVDISNRVDAQASLQVTGSIYASAGASVAASSASLVSFRNDSTTQLGYLASADTQAVTTGLVGYNTSTGNLTISSVIDGGSF